jgi:hypothetical protein
MLIARGVILAGLPDKPIVTATALQYAVAVARQRVIEVAASLRAVTKLGGSSELVPPGSLPNDGKAIADERGYRFRVLAGMG